MIVKNPPAVPAGVPLQSTDPFVQAVEWACHRAGVECEVLPTPSLQITDNNITLTHVRLPAFGISIEVLPGTPRMPRDRHEVRPMIIDGEEGVETLASFLASLSPAP